jgi:hypothetical protein
LNGIDDEPGQSESVPDPHDHDPTWRTLGLVDREIAHAKQLSALHFNLIERQRLESKTDAEARRIETKQDAKEALAAALLTADKNVESLRKTYEAGHLTLIAALDELKTTVTSGTGARAGGKEVWAYIVGALGLLAMGLTAVINLLNWAH